MANATDSLKIVCALNSEIEEHLNEHGETFKNVGKELTRRLGELHNELFPKATRGYRYNAQHWMHVYDYIELKLENGEMNLEFWIRGHGGYGDRDEMLHYLPLTPKLMTPEGMDEYIAKARASLLQESERSRIAAEDDKARKIAAMEKELSILRGA